MNKTTGNLLKCLSIIVLLSAGAMAQEVNRTPPPSIRATGDAIIMAKPDQAQIDIGVLTQAATAKAAASENARKVDAVISALRRVLGPSSEIKTIGYSLNPVYTYPREGGQPRITGYAASNVVQVKTDDLTQVGTVIDTATQAGANNIQSLQFTLKNDQAVRGQALREAALKAKAKADALASALGLRIVRVLHVDESGAAPVPIFARQMEMAASKAADVATPVEPGNIEVRASVSLTVEIAN
ncbi:MAG TPA: SIMPL domain-containing protein [Blastocatellia bacterium]|nr:SIMPL domain-containing protein [Blastocatellia bacterium]